MKKIEKTVPQRKSGAFMYGIMLFLVVFCVAGSVRAAEKGFDGSLMSQKVTLNFSNADLGDVLRIISDDTNINIIAGPDVKGVVTLHVVDVDLNQALNSILRSNGYDYVEEGNILRIIRYEETADPIADLTADLKTEVISLNYISAKDVKDTLANFLSAEGRIEEFKRTSYYSESGRNSNQKVRSKQLVVQDTAEVIELIRAVIADLDRELKRIVIESKIVEVILDDDDKLGIDWTIKATAAGSKTPSTFPFQNRRSTNDRSGNIIPLPADSDSSFAQGSLFPFSTSTDFTFGSLNFTDFQAVLQYLQNKKKTNIISAPHIMTLDNETAFITVGSNVPIPIFERSLETGNTTVTGYDEQNIGIVLSVTPHIVSEKKILVELDPEVSAITGATGPDDERPITSTREAHTTVIVDDGETIAMGGLIDEKKVIVDNRVPLLGSIPLLGKVFSYDEETMDKTELLFFITVKVLDKDKKVNQFVNNFAHVKLDEDAENRKTDKKPRDEKKADYRLSYKNKFKADKIKSRYQDSEPAESGEYGREYEGAFDMKEEKTLSSYTDSGQTQDRIEVTGHMYDKARKLYDQERYAKAKELLTQILANNPYDEVSKELYSLCVLRLSLSKTE